MLPIEDRALLTQTMVGLNVDADTIATLMESFDLAAEGLESDPAIAPVPPALFGDSYTGGYRLATNVEMAHKAVGEELNQDGGRPARDGRPRSSSSARTWSTRRPSRPTATMSLIHGVHRVRRRDRPSAPAVRPSRPTARTDDHDDAQGTQPARSSTDPSTRPLAGHLKGRPRLERRKARRPQRPSRRRSKVGAEQAELRIGEQTLTGPALRAGMEETATSMADKSDQLRGGGRRARPGRHPDR